MNRLRNTAVLCLALVATFAVSNRARASQLHRFVFLSVVSRPEGVIVRDGQFMLAGKVLAPNEVRFSIDIGNVTTQSKEGTSVSGEIMLPILINRGVLVPSRLEQRDFYSTETDNTMTALENFRASSVGGGVARRPNQTVLLERVATSLARGETPNLSDIPGGHLYDHLVEPFISTSLFAELARRVSSLSDGRVRIENAEGNPPDERGLLEGANFGQIKPHFLVRGPERWPILIGTLNFAIFDLGLKPIALAPKLISIGACQDLFVVR